MGRFALGIAIWSKNFPTNGIFHCRCTTQVLFAGHAKFPALPGHLDHHFSVLESSGAADKGCGFQLHSQAEDCSGATTAGGMDTCQAGRIDHQD